MLQVHKRLRRHSICEDDGAGGQRIRVAFRRRPYLETVEQGQEVISLRVIVSELARAIWLEIEHPHPLPRLAPFPKQPNLVLSAVAWLGHLDHIQRDLVERAGQVVKTEIADSLD